jgi:hypothetical protein
LKTTLAILVVAYSLAATAQDKTPAKPEYHKAGELTEVQSLKLSNIGLSLQSYRLKVSEAKANAQEADLYAQNLQLQLAQVEAQIAQEKKELIKQIESDNPGWHWKQLENGNEGLVKDPEPKPEAKK